jgi:hypothetical protein
LLAGYEALDIQKGASFGSHPLLDLVGLVLWGPSADVASRGLGNLTARSATQPGPSLS